MPSPSQKSLATVRPAGNHFRFRKSAYSNLNCVKDLRQNQYRYMPAAMQVGHNSRREQTKDSMSTRTAKYSCEREVERYNLIDRRNSPGPSSPPRLLKCRNKRTNGHYLQPCFGVGAVGECTIFRQRRKVRGRSDCFGGRAHREKPGRKK